MYDLVTGFWYKMGHFLQTRTEMNETWLTGRYLLNGNILHHSFLNLLNEHPVVKEFVEKRKFWCERAEISLELKWILRKHK